MKKFKFFICLMAACADTFLSICRLNDGIKKRKKIIFFFQKHQLSSDQHQHISMFPPRLIWFLLLDSSTGEPYQGTSAEKVPVSSSADVADFLDAVLLHSHWHYFLSTPRLQEQGCL
jgi:hypothetical protein